LLGLPLQAPPGTGIKQTERLSLPGELFVRRLETLRAMLRALKTTAAVSLRDFDRGRLNISDVRFTCGTNAAAAAGQSASRRAIRMRYIRETEAATNSALDL
jgi:hypothetical protein